MQLCGFYSEPLLPVFPNKRGKNRANGGPHSMGKAPRRSAKEGKSRPDPHGNQGAERAKSGQKRAHEPHQHGDSSHELQKRPKNGILFQKHGK